MKIKIKNCSRYASWLLGGLLGCSFFITNAGAFNSDTHKYITQSSLKIISELDDKDEQQSSRDSVSGFFKNIKNDWDLIAEYSVKPDEDENQGLYKYHFYNPVTERNFMNEKTTALSKFVSHFNSAVKHYKEKEKTISYQELGRAIHFLEDLNTPVHTAYETPADSVTKFPLHVRFEKICDEVSSGCKAVVLQESMAYFDVNSVETIAKSSAVLSSDSFYYLENVSGSSETAIAKNSVLNAQKNISGVLYKFFRNVTA